MEKLKYIIEDSTIAEVLGVQNFTNEESAILELVKNAYDAQSLDVVIIISKSQIIIEDNGIGMKKEYLEHIFEPFSRQENSVTNRVQGTGLRMAITKNIVDMMSGIIQIESEEGIGSTFEVIFEDCAPHSRYF